MIRPASVRALIGALSTTVMVVGAPVVVLLAPSAALAQAAQAQAEGTKPRPRVRGRIFKIKVDSSPQQAAVYWDAGPTPAPKDYGVAGYTPITLTVPKGAVRVVLELKGFKPQQRDLDVRKAQSLFVPLERVPMARLEVVAGSDGTATGAEVSIDGVARGTVPNTFELGAGRHNLEVKKQGSKPLARWVDLAEDERRTVEIALEKAEQPAGGSR
jgi:hypothetical protein